MFKIVFVVAAVFALVMMLIAVYTYRNTNLNAFQRRVGYSGIYLFGGILMLALFNLGSMWYRVHSLKQLVSVPMGGEMARYKSSGAVRYWWMSFPRGRASRFYEADNLKGWEFVRRSKNNQIFYRKSGYMLELDLRDDDVHYVVIKSACVSRSHRLSEFGYAGYWVWPNMLKCNDSDKEWNFNYDEEEYEIQLELKYGKKKAMELKKSYGTSAEAFVFEVCMNPIEFRKSNTLDQMRCPTKD